MKTASLSEIKKDLGTLPPKEVLELCIRIAKYKKENKELLSYLLYESADEEAYIASIKDEMDFQFNEINYSNIYYAKKGFRKVLRTANKYIKYSGIRSTEVEVLIYFCQKIKKAKISIHKSQQMVNLYQRQLEKIQKAMITLHEDLQYDYADRLREISSF